MNRQRPGRSILRALPIVILLVSSEAAGAQSAEIVIHIEGIQRGEVMADPIEHIGRKSSRATAELTIEVSPIDLELPSGGSRPAWLIIARDPGTELYWWTFQRAGPGDPPDLIAHLPGRMRLFRSDDEILGIGIGKSPPGIWLVRSTSRIGDLAEARSRAIERLAASAHLVEQRSARWKRSVSLANVLPDDFFWQPYDPRPVVELEVLRVTRDGRDLLVTLGGREGRRAEIRLDHLFLLKQVRELPPAPSDE